MLWKENIKLHIISGDEIPDPDMKERGE